MLPFAGFFAPWRQESEYPWVVEKNKTRVEVMEVFIIFWHFTDRTTNQVNRKITYRLIYNENSWQKPHQHTGQTTLQQSQEVIVSSSDWQRWKPDILFRDDTLRVLFSSFLIPVLKHSNITQLALSFKREAEEKRLTTGLRAAFHSQLEP